MLPPTKSVPGQVVVTQGINALPLDVQASVMLQIAQFDDFDEGNDPYAERDFGMVQFEDVGDIYWKIDLYDVNLEYGSENPADPNDTMRVLTVMLAAEY